MAKNIVITSGSARIQDARGDADGTATEGCSISVVSNKTRVILDAGFTYIVGRNSGGSKGDLTVEVNGQVIERTITGTNDEVGAVLFDEVNSSTIDIYEIVSIGPIVTAAIPASIIITIGRVKLSTEDSSTTPWQKKTIAGATGGTGAIPSLTFNNLTIGNTYKITGQVYLFDSNGGASRGGLDLKQGATFINRSVLFVNQNVVADTFATGQYGITTVFTATTTTLDAFGNSAVSGSVGSDTFLILEELPNHTEVTTWT